MEKLVPCPHCDRRHKATRTVCSTTGKPLLGESDDLLTTFRPMQAPKPGASAVKPPLKRRSEREKELLGRTIDGKYRVRSTIGEGALGMVFEAHHLGLDREVALKVLHPSEADTRGSVERFHREAQAAGAIGHPNICRVYDFGELSDGSPYMVLEKLNGVTLRNMLTAQGRLHTAFVIDVFVQILAGLSAAHEKGIVHRDIKPSNIFLVESPGPTPLVKILDFGVSKLSPALLDGDELLTVTGSGIIIGTPGYMAPEQARGERNLDGRADLHAVGVMLYEALTGKRPFATISADTLRRRAPAPPKRATALRPSLPLAFDRILEVAMSPSRESRYHHALDFQRDLHAVKVGAPPPFAPPPPPPPPPPPMRTASPSELTTTEIAFIDDSDEETRVIPESKRPR